MTARFLRKHRTALIALAVYHFVLFFPVAFMGRVLSPNDVFYNYSPWAEMRPADIQQAQNSTINDPPTAYYTLMSLARDDWRTFHWNPYIASGIPGFGSSASAILSPFILFPALLVPPAWVFTVIVFLKLNFAFLFAYLWLREEGLGKKGAAIGALVVAGAGVYAVRWLWQITNATALYPALLWVVRRALNGKRLSVTVLALLALAYGLAGFPSAILYGAWTAAAYFIAGWLFWRRGGVRSSFFWRAAVAVVIALMIAAPSLVPFAQFLRRSGYLETRKTVSTQFVFQPDHWKSFFNADRLGHPAYKNWKGDPRLGPINNYTETTVYLGAIVVALAVIGVFQRRARARWFWLAFAAVVLACMFGTPYVSAWVGMLPGFKYTALARAALLLPLAIGYLAAAGARGLRGQVAPALVAVVIAFDLSLVAGRFYPFLEPRRAVPAETPMVAAMRSAPKPFRIAPFFDYFWPNSAEWVRVEDLRSHFGSEADYRKLLLRLDPTAWSGTSTVITFNSLQYKFTDPLNALLGVRWYVEHNGIDIIKWSIFEATRPGVKETGSIRMRPGFLYARTIRVDAEPFWSIELPVTVEKTRGRRPRLEIVLMKDGQAVWSRDYTRADTSVMNKIYIPLRPYARLGETVTLRVFSRGMEGWLLEGENANPRETPLFYGRVTVPTMFDRQLPDGRLFRNLSELPRFRAVTRLRKLNDEEFLVARDVDFETEAVITDDPVMPPALVPGQAKVSLLRYEPDEQRIGTESASPFFLASSEKLTPELRITVDGRTVRPIEVDMMFAGVEVPAGRHEVVYSRRIARGWWWVAAAGAALLIAAAAAELIASRRRG